MRKITVKGNKCDWVVETVYATSGPEVKKLFSCPTQLSMNFKLRIKTKVLMKENFAFKFSDIVSIVKMGKKIFIIFSSKIKFI